MYGPHDLGGKHGLGPVDPEPESEEPVFHYDWERRVFALTLATGMLGRWNIDESRYARERQHPVDYLRHSYYENWLAGISKLLVEKGLIGADELERLRAGGDQRTPAGLAVPGPEDARRILSSGGPTLLESTIMPKFPVGARVRVKKNHTSGHTRVPAYVQGSEGVIERHQGCHIFPDTHVRGVGVVEEPAAEAVEEVIAIEESMEGGEHLYSVRFDSESLWGVQSVEPGGPEEPRGPGEPGEPREPGGPGEPRGPEENTDVLIDLWEPCLEASGGDS